jgi:hypothetical protein
MKKNNKRLDGKKMCLALTSRIQRDMRSFCRDKGIESESELVRQAIAKYIYADYEDETLKLQGLKKLEDKQMEIRDMINILFNYIKWMHVNILAYHPELDKSFSDAAFNSANFRHDKFFNVFQDALINDPPLFERLLSKYYSSGDTKNNE